MSPLDDMDRAIDFHMGIPTVQPQTLNGRQEEIERTVRGFIARARDIDHLQHAFEYVELLEKQLVILQDVAVKLSEPVKKAAQDLQERKAQHARLEQELARLNQELKKKSGIQLSHTPQKAGRR